MIKIAPMGSTEYLEHAEDVLARWLEWHSAAGAALVVVTKTEGGAVRAPGALLAVSRCGSVAGYLSGGCIDADVALHARAALENGQARTLRYGAGSPFKDLPLPCGGAIEVAVLPDADRDAVARCHRQLTARLSASLDVSIGDCCFEAHYAPKLRLRIAGRGADALALARLSKAAGIPVSLWLRDDEDIDQAKGEGHSDITRLETPSALPEACDDAWTAFALMFHDGDWEGPLLRQALSGPAFHIGAVGSRRTHQRRCEALRAAGVSEAQISRVRGPVGLVASLRDASMLAVSALAEIVEAYKQCGDAPMGTTALVMLAAGQSSRFEAGDKLLAGYRGQPLLAHAAGLLSDQPVAHRLAVVGPADTARSRELQSRGWSLAVNPDAMAGQGTSLARAIEVLGEADGVDAALIMLADMPDVPEQHLLELRQALLAGVQAVMSCVNGTPCPPALFHRSIFPQLRQLTGDRGARGLFQQLSQTRTVTLAPRLGRDIDTLGDLADASGEIVHG